LNETTHVLTPFNLKTKIQETASVSTDFHKSKQNADGEDIKLMILGKLFQRPRTHL